MKKIIFLFAIIGLTSFIASSANGIFGGGNGTSGSPYIIEDAADLNAVRDYLNNSNIYFKLANDIDLTSYLAVGGDGYTAWGDAGWLPIGVHDSPYENNPFQGKFDGDNFKIIGLKINRDGENYIGLFGYTYDAIIENLAIEGCDIIGQYTVGGLVGYNENTPISNCYVTGKISGIKDVGGLVGQNGDANISNCYTTVTVIGIIIGTFGEVVGGLVGSNWRSIITNCSATGNISGKNEVGGLVGKNIENTIITNCYATGNVTGIGNVIGTGSGIGGLVGSNFCYDTESGISTIKNCYATGNVSGKNYVGGLVGVSSAFLGEENDYIIIENCYAAGNIILNNNNICLAGGLVGYCKRSIIKNCVAANESITSQYPDSEMMNPFRIVGTDSDEMLLINNYANKVMHKDGYLAIYYIGLNKGNGANSTIANFKTENFYTTTTLWNSTAWDFTNTWTIPQDGCMFPQLQTNMEAIPAINTINSNICIGNSAALFQLNKPLNGTWTSNNTAIATINSQTGAVTGISNGKTTFTFNSIDDCFVITTDTITIKPIPQAPICPQDLIIKNSEIVTLENATPSNGIYSGIGIINNFFDPSGLQDNTSYTITYTYTNTEGCSNYCEFTITLSFGTNIDDYLLQLNNSEITILPNPTTGIITISAGRTDNYSQQQDATIYIYDISGRMVQTQLIASQRNANENDITIDISHLQQGMYYIKIGNETVKIIKN